MKINSVDKDKTINLIRWSMRLMSGLLTIMATLLFTWHAPGLKISIFIKQQLWFMFEKQLLRRKLFRILNLLCSGEPLTHLLL